MAALLETVSVDQPPAVQAALKCIQFSLGTGKDTPLKADQNSPSDSDAESDSSLVLEPNMGVIILEWAGAFLPQI